MSSNRIIGIDMHPDVFAAAALVGPNPLQVAREWMHDRQPTAQLETWAKKWLRAGDTVVLEALGNSFEVARRPHPCGVTAVELESRQASYVRDNSYNYERHSAVELAWVYLSGMAKVVWEPAPVTWERRELFFAHRNAVRDATRCRTGSTSSLTSTAYGCPRTRA